MSQAISTKLLITIFKISIILNGFEIIPGVIVKFSNLNCQTLDEKYALIPECRLRALGRNKVALSVHLKMLQLPLRNLEIGAQLMRKSYDYRPFMYNFTTEFCSFVKNGHKFLFWKVIYDIIKSNTNANHSCPYNHDLVLKDLILNEDLMKNILFPVGDYLIRLHYYTNSTLKLYGNIYFTIKDF